MAKLSINVNLVAYIRNRRSDCRLPDLIKFARLALESEASGITAHPRPDERHITTTDIFDLSRLLTTRYPHKEFNIEGYPADRFIELVQMVTPQQVTLVPDDPSQKTSDHGWNVDADAAILREAYEALNHLETRISVFVDHDVPKPQLKAISETGVHCVELYTGPYAASSGKEQAEILKAMTATARTARDCGLKVNAGHDLNLNNVQMVRRAIPELHEVSIGHALFVEALENGLAATIKSYTDILKSDDSSV